MLCQPFALCNSPERKKTVPRYGSGDSDNLFIHLAVLNHSRAASKTLIEPFQDVLDGSHLKSKAYDFKRGSHGHHRPSPVC